MALVLANRVQETATPNTTVSFTLTGAVSGFQTFAVIGNTNTTYYSATDTAGNWEVGEGTYSTTGPTLARTTIYASSNSGSAVTFPGTVNVFVTYPSGKSVNLDGSGNVSALGTVTSGVWQGSTVGVAYGGTGVTSSSGPNSVVLRDANSNITVNRINQGLQTVTATGGVTILTVASQFNQALVGTGNHTFRLPDATTLSATTAFQFNNNATGTLTIQNNAGTTVGTIAPGGAAGIALLSNATVGGTWDVHAYIPENVTWGSNALALGSTVISGGTWQGGTIQSGYGGTGLTTFVGPNNALYSTGASTLTAGILPVAAGGTGTTSPSLIGGVNISISGCWPSQTINSTVPPVSCATPTVAGIVYGRTETCCGGNTMLGYGINTFGFAYSNNVFIGNNTTNLYAMLSNNVVIGGATVCCNTSNSVVIGSSSYASYYTACGVAVGRSAVAYVQNVAVGAFSATSLGGTSVGYSSYSAYEAVAVGYNAAANGCYSVAVGKCSTAGYAGVAVGINANTAAHCSAIAIGPCVSTTGSSQTHIGPIRNVCSTSGLQGLFYCSTTKEVIRGAAGGFSGTLAIANGGTGQTTQQAALNALSGPQTANRVLRSNGTNVTLSQVALATDVSGTLPTANGGTNLTTFGAANRALYSTSASALTAGTLPVAAGGTGTTSPSLIAGTNVTISGSWPNQTISASGGGGGGSPATPLVSGTVYGRTDLFGANNTGLGHSINFNPGSACTVLIGNSTTYNLCGSMCNVVIGIGAVSGNCSSNNVLVGRGAYAYCYATCAVSVGRSSIANSYGVSIGANALSGQNYNVAIGKNAYSASCSSVAIGRFASASFCMCFAPSAVAIGPFASTNGANTVAIGSSASTLGIAPFVSDGAIAVGNAALAGYQNSIAIGNGVTTSGPNQTHIKPIRNASGPFTLRYNPCSGEITYN